MVKLLTTQSKILLGKSSFSALQTEKEALGSCKYFARFSAWATYVISQLDQGYPVAVDIHAAPHFLNMVGYDESGVWVHESNLAEPPKAQPFGLGLPRGDDSGISIEVAQPFETLKQSRFYLRAKSTNTGSAAPVPFYLAGLECNRVDATWGGRMLEVPTSNDPVRIIPPPPK